MAGQGPAPAENRRRRNEPQRGEWVDIGPLKKPVLPALPRRSKDDGPWSPRTVAAWAAWRADPVTGEYGQAEIQAAIDLAYIYEEWVRGKWSLTSEIRQFQDRLGLNPKGKRDLRWRIVEKAPTVEAPRRAGRAKAKRAHLTAV